MRNPLIKRIPKELKSEWHKYIVIIVFMVFMIGLISGMYVGHDGMLLAIENGKEELNLEDGSFELKKRASKALIEDISTGERADVREYFIDKGMKEADREVEKAVNEELDKQVRQAIEEGVRAQCKAFGITDEGMIKEQTDKAITDSYDEAIKEAKESDEFKEAEEEAYKEAHDEVIKEVDEKWDEIEDRYDLDDDNFSPVTATIYENFFRNESEDVNDDGEKDATVRIYKSDSEIDKASFNEGRAPEKDDEIAIDRMHADNVGIEVGDKIHVGGKEFTVTGLLSYVNYLTLHESNNDLMFDAFGFDVAMVTPGAFDKFKSRIHYSYAYKYDIKPEEKTLLSDTADNFLKALITQTLVHDNEIEDYLPEYLRQASNFAPSDIEGDTTSTCILCYILIGVIAFIFAITISNTIDKEASVIGTLRASGYSKSELTIHYMSMPVIVTLVGALIGNILGYTSFRDVAVDLYYQSYSLPVCSTVWSNEALIKTTVIPLVLMFFINLFVIINKLRLSPLKFLRHDLSRKKKSKAMRLPSWSFLKRFRLRVLFQNVPNYIILIFGVVFIEIMMCFGFGLPDSLSNYSANAADMMFAPYQYILISNEDDDGKIIKTKEETAERFSTTSLMYPKNIDSSLRVGMGSGGDEKVTVYGIEDGSSYVDIDKDSDGVYISSAFKSKFDISDGALITLNEEYEDKSYEFTVKGTVDYDGGIAVFMSKDMFDEVFDKEEGDFSGYLSRNEITDIEEKYIAVTITEEDIKKVTAQLDHSIGGIVRTFKYILVILAAALIYLLAKIIIEKNEQAISMSKILGFKNSEIGSIYLIPTAIVVILFSIISFFIGYYIMLWIFKVFVMQMDGYFAFYMSYPSMILSIVYLLIGYAFVSILDYIRIKRIPMDVALKNVE